MLSTASSEITLRFRDAKPDLTPILVSKRDAAQLLNLCVRTIEQLIRRRELPAKRVGKRVLILREDLERFARER